MAKRKSRGSCPPLSIELQELIQTVRRTGLSTSEGVVEADATKLSVAYKRRFQSACQALELTGGKRLRRKRLDRPGTEKVCDLMIILSITSGFHQPDESMIITPLVYCIASVIRRIDTCYCIIDDMLKSDTWCLESSITDYRIKLGAFRQVIGEAMPRTFETLIDLQALTDQHLNKIFSGFFFPVLRRDHAMRIVDCFLVEGEKVIFRFGFALLSYFKSSIKEMPFADAEELWKFISEKSLQIDFERLSAIAFETNRSPVAKLIKPTKLSRQVISKLKEDAKAAYDLELGSAQERAIMAKLKSDLAVNSIVSTWFDQALLQKSLILTPPQGIRLHTFLRDAKVPPSSMGLVFSAEVDGWDLSRFYAKMATSVHSRHLILMRSEQSKAVFGAFLSCALAPADGQTRGDCSSFIFRLDSKTPVKHGAVTAPEWETTPASGVDSVICAVLNVFGADDEHTHGPLAIPLELALAHKQIAQFHPTNIIIGTSCQPTAVNAIKIVDDLRRCHCGTSDTFANKKALITEETSPFAIDAFEVYSCSEETDAMEEVDIGVDSIHFGFTAGTRVPDSSRGRVGAGAAAADAARKERKATARASKSTRETPIPPGGTKPAAARRQPRSDHWETGSDASDSSFGGRVGKADQWETWSDASDSIIHSADRHNASKAVAGNWDSASDTASDADIEFAIRAMARDAKKFRDYETASDAGDISSHPVEFAIREMKKDAKRRPR